MIPSSCYCVSAIYLHSLTFFFRKIISSEFFDMVSGSVTVLSQEAMQEEALPAGWSA
jgi:hypothetical protein